jgi:hypothetical protein
VLGMLTIGSIVLSSIGWFINLGMGLFFIMIGVYLYFRGNSLHRFYSGAVDNLQDDPKFRRFLRLDLLFVIISCVVSGAFLTGAFIRIFFEGFAVFG